MKFRRTVREDLKDVMGIIRQAQKYFKEQAIDQWQNNYPNEEVIINDINNEGSYVLLKDNKIVASAALYFDGEKTYKNIYEGEWITNGPYAVIHRIAVDNNLKGTGIAHEIIKEVEKLCLNNNINSIKVDTHEDNKSMQKMLLKNEFKYCGVIYLEDGSKRVAFEKVLE